MRRNQFDIVRQFREAIYGRACQDQCSILDAAEKIGYEFGRQSGKTFARHEYLDALLRIMAELREPGLKRPNNLRAMRTEAADYRPIATVLYDMVGHEDRNSIHVHPVPRR